nr:hypothetical protein [Tanacetum cinerariifolium]
MVTVEEQLLKEDVENIIVGEDEESDGTEFVDSVFLDEEYSGDRLEPESHKENLEKIDDDDDDDVDEKKDNKKDDDDDHDLYKTIAEEVTVSATPTTATLSQRRLKLISKRYTDITGALIRMCMGQGFKLHQMEKKYITNRHFQVANAVTKERESSQAVVPTLISQEFVTRAPKIIKELFRIHMQNTILNVHPTTIASTATTTSDLQQKLYLKMKSELQAQVADLEFWDVFRAKFEKSSASSGSYRDDVFCKREHDDHQGDDAPPEGEKNAKRQKTTSKISKSRNPNKLPRYLYNKDLFLLKYANTEKNSFSEADFKYLNKNDIEDMYYLFLNKKVNYRENKLLNSLLTFIKSCVIWERVHDFQLGIESYQIKINLTAPTLIFPSIEECNPFSIVDKHTTSLIYLNSKNEKRFMDLKELSRFYDDTLKKVQKEVKIKIFETKFIKKTPLLGSLDLKIMKAYEREIMKRLRHREKMRRYESFVNGRLILQMMKR